MPAPVPTDLASARACIAQVQAAALQQGLALRPPPPEPVGCCGRGCNGCVWEGFYAALAWWQEDAEGALTTLAVPAAQAG